MTESVLVISHEYPPVPSGGSYVLERLINWGISHEIEIELFLPTFIENMGMPDPHFINRIAVSRSGHRSMTPSSMLKFIYFGARKLRKIIKSGEQQTIFAFFTIPSGLIVYLSTRFSKTKTVLMVDGIDLPNNPESPLSRFPGTSWLVSRILNNFGEIILVDGMQDEFKQLTNRRFIAIPNGREIVANAMPRLRGGTLRIITISRFVPRKRIQIGLQAVVNLINEGYKIHYTIVGDGPMRVDLEAFVRSHLSLDKLHWITFTGFVDQADLEKYYQNSDLYLFTGLNEGSSMAMIDAMSFGLATVATLSEGNMRYIDSGITGILVNESESTGYQNAIKILYEDKSLFERMSQAAIEQSRNLSWDSICQAYWEVIAGLGK
jgi:glycosyltransferase involved in cell wall biosynthesis